MRRHSANSSKPQNKWRRIVSFIQWSFTPWVISSNRIRWDSIRRKQAWGRRFILSPNRGVFNSIHTHTLKKVPKNERRKQDVFCKCAEFYRQKVFVTCQTNAVTQVVNSIPSQAPDWRTGFWFIAEALIFSSPHLSWLRERTCLTLDKNRESSSEIDWPRCEVDESPVPGIKVKNEWSSTSSLHCVFSRGA